MQHDMQGAFSTMLENWNKMQRSELEEAQDDAERFELSFYDFMEEVEKWLKTLNKKPTNYEETTNLPEIKEIMEQLPVPLYINFETELELIIEKL